MKTRIFLILLIFVLLSVRIIFYIISQYRESLWDGRSNLAIAFKGQENYLVLLNNLHNNLYVIKIPSNTVISYGNFDNYTLNAIWKLGSYAKNSKSLYVKAVQSFFGYPVSAYYANEKINLDNFDLKLTDVLLKKTNLSVFDYFKIKNITHGIVKKSLTDYVKPTVTMMNEEKRLIFDNTAIDHQLKDIFIDTNLSNLRYTVQIKGSAAKKSQIENLSRLVNNIGWKVADIEYVDKTKPDTECILKTEDQPPNHIQDYRLKHIFDCQKLIYQNGSYYDLIVCPGLHFGD